MELVDPDASVEYALQCIRWCTQQGDTPALNEHIKLHRDKLIDTGREYELIELLLNAFSNSHSGVVIVLLNALDKEIEKLSNIEKSWFSKLFCNAIELGYTDIVKCLIDKGANVNERCNGKPILHTAACSGHIDVVEELLRAGADVHDVDRRGDGIIHSILISQMTNKEKAVRRIITVGADPLVKSSSGKLPIHIAATNSPEVLDLLLQEGQDVNTVDHVNNDTPLHLACGLSYRESIPKLIQHGSRFNMENKQGQTPLAKLLRFTNDYFDFHTKTRLTIARKLISVGFRMTTSSMNGRGRDKCYERYIALRESLNTPPSLQCLARLTVRESLSLGIGFRNEIHNFDIPMNLKAYLLFQDLIL